MLRFKDILCLIVFFVFPIKIAIGNFNQSILPIQCDTIFPNSCVAPSAAVQIQGNSIPLLFDTGASVAVVLSDVAVKKYNLNLQYPGGEICAQSQFGVRCMKKIIIPEMTIGSFTLHSIAGALNKDAWIPGIDNEANKNGILGLDLFRKFNLLLDYPKRKIILTKRGRIPKNYIIKNSSCFPFTLEGGVITTKAVINQTPVILLWDSGAPSALNNTFFDRAGLSKQVCSLDRNLGNPDCYESTINSFQINNVSLPSSIFMYIEISQSLIPFEGFVGAWFYENNKVYFDFLHDTICLPDN